MERFFGLKGQYERWIEENKDTIIIFDALVKEVDNITFILVLYTRKEI